MIACGTALAAVFFPRSWLLLHVPKALKHEASRGCCGEIPGNSNIPELVHEIMKYTESIKPTLLLQLALCVHHPETFPACGGGGGGE